MNKQNQTFEDLYNELITIHGNKLGKEISFEVFAEGYKDPIAKVSNDTYVENFTDVRPEELMKAEYLSLYYKNNHYIIKVKVIKLPLKTKDEYIGLISKASDRYGNKLIELMDKYRVINLKQITLEQARQFYEEEIEKLPF